MHGSRPIAKLTRPRLHGAVARERLFAYLDDARRDRAAICVVAPPGAGKTTLVASWLDARAARGIWYQIDPGDSDLATFFHYLGQAAAPYGQKGQQQPLPALTPEYLKDVEGFSRRFFRDVFARMPDGAVLVLDNYQEVGPEQALHALVASAVDELPPGIMLMAISRRDPPATYARLIAHERVAIVDWDQIKLTLDEARAIAGARLCVDDAEIQQMHERSGGWAAGLTLLLEGRRRGGPQATILPTGLHGIFDYFAGQIFGQVPDTVQRFLVATALLPQVPVSIARDLTGNERAGAILEDLYHRHLFTHRRPGAEPVYWYHALFRDFLKARADTVLGARHIGEFLSRAARLLEAAGAFDDAFELFREATDWAAAGRLIQRRASDLLSHGRGQTLREWIQALPDEMLEEQPWLLYWLGTSLTPLNQPHAREYLERAFERFRALGDSIGQALSAAGSIDAYVFEWNDFRPVRRWVDALDLLIDRLQLADHPDLEQRVLSSFLLGMLYVAPDHARLPWCVARVTEMLDEDLEVASKFAVATRLLAYCNLTADEARASVAAARGSTLFELADVTPFARLWWLLRLALHSIESGLCEEALALLDDAEHIAIAEGFQHVGNVMSLLWMYRVIAAGTQGDLRATRENAQGLTKLGLPSSPVASYNLCLAAVCRNLAAGKSSALATNESSCVESARSTGMVYLEILALTHRAVGLAASGAPEELAACLSRQRGLARGTCFSSFEIDAEVIYASDLLAKGDMERGFAAIRAAFGRGRLARWRPLNVLRCSPAYREIFAAACEAGIESDYVADLIRRFRIDPPSWATQAWPWRVKVFVLGRFEIHVAGTPLAFNGKVPKKPLALLKALVTFGAHVVSASKLADTLWPDEDGDAARKALEVNVARLRKLLGSQEAVVVSNDTVGLNSKLCWVDAHDFLARSESVDHNFASDSAKACALYGGTFLPGDLDAPWTVPRREHLRDRFIRLIETVGAEAEANGAWGDAVDWYRRGIEVDELAEHFHQGLMRCYRTLGCNAQAMSAYRRLRQTLEAVLGIAPSQATQALAQAIRSEASARTTPDV